MRPSHQGFELVLVHTLEGHGVDLDGQSGRLRRLDAVENLIEVAPACHRAELRRIKRVERDIDASDAVSRKVGRVSVELGAVGRQRELIERARSKVARQRGHERHDAAPHQRFAAGQPQLAHPFGDEGRAEPVKLFERENVGLGQEGHVFRHAIDAAEIAAVRDRHAQVSDGAAEWIDQRLRCECRGAFELDHPRLLVPRHLEGPIFTDVVLRTLPVPGNHFCGK